MDNNLLNVNQSEYKVLSEILSELSINKEVVQKENGLIQLELTDKEAEETSAKVQDKLQTEGFALDYSPTEKGRILESLIDRFYDIGWS